MENDSYKSTLLHGIRRNAERDLISRRSFVSILISGSLLATRAFAQPMGDQRERFRRMSEEAERAGLTEPFKGITTDGKVTEGLFPINSTGVSTAPARNAAETFLASLSAEQRARTMFPINDPEWRKWMNQHFYLRQGMGFIEMRDAQREAAIGLLRASLSDKGLRLTRDIMRLNEPLGELNNNNLAEYGESRYWITVMGVPSAKEPWGWQLDGHHAVINYFVLGDQVVMTPTFRGPSRSSRMQASTKARLSCKKSRIWAWQ